MVEELKWVKPSNPDGVPTWSHDGIICTGEIYKAKVKLTFMHGAALDDPTGLFNASLGAAPGGPSTSRKATRSTPTTSRRSCAAPPSATRPTADAEEGQSLRGLVLGDRARLLVLGQHGDAPLVSIVLRERRREEQSTKPIASSVGVVAGADADDVGVVVLAGQLRRLLAPDQAAGTPATLFAAICSPLPEPPITMPRLPGVVTVRCAAAMHAGG